MFSFPALYALSQLDNSIIASVYRLSITYYWTDFDTSFFYIIYILNTQPMRNILISSILSPPPFGFGIMPQPLWLASLALEGWRARGHGWHGSQWGEGALPWHPACLEGLSKRATIHKVFFRYIYTINFNDFGHYPHIYSIATPPSLHAWHGRCPVCLEGFLNVQSAGLKTLIL